MKNLVWLASYPKSGNTWVRACLMLAITGDLSLDKLFRIVPYFPVLNNVHFKSKKFSDLVKAGRAAVRMWDKTQFDLSSNYNDRQFIVKTHQVFGNINNVQFPNLDCAWGVIQLVRIMGAISTQQLKNYLMKKIVSMNKANLGHSNLYHHGNLIF